MFKIQRQTLGSLALEDANKTRAETIAVEGFMDFIHQIFGKKNPKLRREDLKSLFWRDIEQVKLKLMDTIGNKEWVAENYKPRQIRIGQNDLAHLVIDGKLVKPAQAITRAEKMLGMLDHVQNGSGEFERYSQDLQNGLKEIEGFYKSQHQPTAEDVEKFAKEVIAKIKVPGPNYKNHAESVWKPRHEAMLKAKALHGSELPELSQDEVKQTAVLIIKTIDVVKG
jgi:hypothetical protein